MNYTFLQQQFPNLSMLQLKNQVQLARAAHGLETKKNDWNYEQDVELL